MMDNNTKKRSNFFEDDVYKYFILGIICSVIYCFASPEETAQLEFLRNLQNTLKPLCDGVIIAQLLIIIYSLIAKKKTITLKFLKDFGWIVFLYLQIVAFALIEFVKPVLISLFS